MIHFQFFYPKKNSEKVVFDVANEHTKNNQLNLIFNSLIKQSSLIWITIFNFF